MEAASTITVFSSATGNWGRVRGVKAVKTAMILSTFMSLVRAETAPAPSSLASSMVSLTGRPRMPPAALISFVASSVGATK